MVSIDTFRRIALSFPGTVEQAHFEKRAFKAGKKRIFTTLSEKENTATVRLTEVDQSVYSDIDSAMIYPVPNKWGKQGWTVIELKRVPLALVKEILQKAYHYSAT